MTRLFEAKPFVIAEVGSNWTTLPECLESIVAAKLVGAHAVKFQAFSVESLYGFYDSKYSEHRHIGGGELPLEWLPKLKAMADSEGIEFMCTAFSPELVKVVDPYVSVHKVASSDAAWPQMLEAVAATKKPTLVSFGAKKGRDIERASEILGKGNVFVPMLCVAEYPADYVDLTWLDHWENAGFSDHTLGFTAAVEAGLRGAIVIEKHFTAFPDMDTPDRPHSLTPDQFMRMAKILRSRAPGAVTPIYEDGREQLMHLRANRRLIATKDITPGETLRYDVNFGSYRSLKDDTRAASPWDWEKVNGRVAKGLIKRGDGVALEDVE